MGEKVIMFINFMVAFIGSVVLALVKGWELALICLISFPISMISMGFIMRVSKQHLIIENYKSIMKYGQWKLDEGLTYDKWAIQ